MRFWRIGVWLLVLLAAILVSAFGRQMLGQYQLYTLIVILTFAAIFFLVSIVRDRITGRNIDKEMSSVEEAMKSRDEWR
jgi:amino acid transporter